jgi:hypothetical protein
MRDVDLADPVFNGIVRGWIRKKVQKLEVHTFPFPAHIGMSAFHDSYSRTNVNVESFTLVLRCHSMQEPAALCTMHEELPVVPTDIANIVAKYMVSHSWEETKARITLYDADIGYMLCTENHMCRAQQTD